MKYLIRQLMIGMSSYTNHVVAAKIPDSCPFIIVCEFPRSGGTWIRDMLGDSLQLPVPRYSLLPITFRSLVHSHITIAIKHSPVVYVVRDGRDVFVSHFHKAVSTLTKGTDAMRKRVLKYHPSLVEHNSKSIEHLMIDFYDEWKVRPIGSNENWGDHITSWLLDSTDNITRVRYEDMRENPRDTLRKVANVYSEQPVSDEVIDFAVYRNSFEIQTGRKPGQVSNTQNKRSGRAGAWKEDLPDELKERFIKDFDKALSIAEYL